MKKSNTTTSAYTHILTYTGLFGGVQGLTILLGMVRTKLVAILLGPAGVGLISLFNSTLTLLANATNLGLAMSAATSPKPMSRDIGSRCSTPSAVCDNGPYSLPWWAHWQEQCSARSSVDSPSETSIIVCLSFCSPQS